MRKLIMLALVAVIIGGCNLKNEQRIEAYQRWYRARASVIASLGEEHLKAGDLDKAKARANEALTLDDQCVPGRMLLAKVLLESGRYGEAAEQLRRAQKDAPDNAEIPHLLGVALEKRRDYAEALKAYDKARALDPSNDAYVTASAEAMVAWGKPELALELLETRLERTDGSLPMLALAGELAMLLREPEKAAGFYQGYLDLSPRNLSAREGLAKALFFAGKYAGSLGSLTQLSQDPQYRDKASWVYIMTGDCHMALNRPREARSAYQTATQIDPEDARVWVCLAQAAAATGDADWAMMAARRATALDPDYPGAKLVLAYALMMDGQPARAAKILAAQAKKKPKDTTVLCMLGRCYASMGRRDEAVSCYVKALRSDPQHRLAKRLLAASGPPPGGKH
jgi:tetratricopeptide (TPR) repeat protein